MADFRLILQNGKDHFFFYKAQQYNVYHGKNHYAQNKLRKQKLPVSICSFFFFFFFLRQKEVPVQIKKRKLTVNSHIFSCTYTGAL